MNTWLEDLAQVVGYSATAKLSGWFGGSNLYVPGAASTDHQIAKVIGYSAMCRLVEEFGGETIPIPIDSLRDETRRDRVICAMLAKGVPLRDVAMWSKLSTRQVATIRTNLEAAGLLPQRAATPELDGEAA